MGLGAKILYSGFVNNKGADQLAHWRNLISANVNIRLSENTMSNLATSGISNFYLVSVAEQADLWSETLKTGFLPSRHIMYLMII